MIYRSSFLPREDRKFFVCNVLRGGGGVFSPLLAVGAAVRRGRRRGPAGGRSLPRRHGGGGPQARSGSAAGLQSTGT